LKLVRALLPVVLFAASFAAVCVLVRERVPWPENSQLRVKWRHFAAHQDEFDAVFVGSSRVLRAFVPAEFEKALRADARAFNFGVSGMRELEAEHLVERILSERPARLKWLLVEWQTPDPLRPDRSERLTDRSVYWHTPAATLRAFEAIAHLDVGLDERAAGIVNHVLPFLAWATNYGAARAVIEDLLGRPVKKWSHLASDRLLLRRRGYAPILEPDVEWDRKRWPPGPRQWAFLLNDLDRGNGDVVENPDARVAERILARASALGVRVVFVVMPGRDPTPEAYRLAEAGRLAPLLAYNQPPRFPELYELAHRFDAKYLNHEGAVLFSRRLAQDLKALRPAP
jgi:hypothetical protein